MTDAQVRAEPQNRQVALDNMSSGFAAFLFFVNMPLFIVWTVLSILCNKCKVEFNL